MELTLFTQLFRFLKTMKNTQAAKEAANIAFDEDFTDSLGWAWEHGAKLYTQLRKTIDSSVDNPFLNPNWRESIVEAGELNA